MIDDANVTAPPHYAGDGAIECRRAQLSTASYESYLDELSERIVLMANRYGIVDRQPRLF